MLVGRDVRIGLEEGGIYLWPQHLRLSILPLHAPPAVNVKMSIGSAARTEVDGSIIRHRSTEVPGPLWSIHRGRQRLRFAPTLSLSFDHPDAPRAKLRIRHRSVGREIHHLAVR